MKKITRNIKAAFWALALVTFGLVACESEIGDPFYGDSELLVSAYLEQNADYSEYYRILERAEMASTLNTDGDYTCFVPNNEAVGNYLADKGISSVEAAEVEDLKLLVRFHTLVSTFSAIDFPNGVLKDSTVSGDYIVTEIGDGGINDITINRQAKILKRDIKVANGMIHEIDKLVDPKTQSVYDVLERSGRFSIFAEAIMQTGLADTLKKVTLELPNGSKARTRFTLIAETDELLQSKGIESFEALKAMYSDTDDITDPANGLYQYVAYHCLPGAYFLNELSSKNYLTFGKDLISLVVGEDFRINERENEEGKVWTNFVESESNEPARNGVIHVIDKQMPPYSPPPVDLKWFIGAQPELMAMPGYDKYHFNYYEQMSSVRWFNNLNYIRVRIKAGHTFLNMGHKGGFFWAEFDMPKIVKGKYDVYLNTNPGGGRGTVQCFFDGKRLGEPRDLTKRDGGDPRSRQINPGEEGVLFSSEIYLGAVNLKETEEHLVKFITIKGGAFPVDYLRFVPITDEAE
ncbi:hypothetical protein FUAX_42500 (plasmid) [Fulvitalea axinellae]|uniref:FAS1 domain-containing protein n=1 Tax=Fulvitalea axinellae TaxID=1182444 RepID=A0AAU9CNE9_9BACT|nr:hypothetical protein FUAX_42500 [Fulvitalea axinellae]